jgi:hypothetical protein
MAPLIQGQVDQILDAAEAGGRLDIVTDLAYPVPQFFRLLSLTEPFTVGVAWRDPSRYCRGMSQEPHRTPLA